MRRISWFVLALFLCQITTQVFGTPIPRGRIDVPQESLSKLVRLMFLDPHLAEEGYLIVLPYGDVENVFFRVQPLTEENYDHIWTCQNSYETEHDDTGVHLQRQMNKMLHEEPFNPIRVEAWGSTEGGRSYVVSSCEYTDEFLQRPQGTLSYAGSTYLRLNGYID